MCFSLKNLTKALCAAVFASFFAGSALAEITLSAGDKITVSVVGHDSLNSEVTIGPRGVVILPLLGEISADGKTLADLRREIIEGYSGAVYRVGTGSGDVVRSIDAISVLVEIAEYRPIYVFGDVRSPGSLDYRPGLTLLQAVASMGGPGVSLDSAPDATLLAQRLQTQAAVLERQIALGRLDIERLREDLRNLLQSAPQAEGLVQRDDAVDIPDDSWAFARQRARTLRDAQTAEAYARLENRRNILETQEANAMQVVSLYAESVASLEADALLRPINEQSLLDMRQALLIANARALEIGAELSRIELELSRTGTQNAIIDQVEVTRTLNLISEREAALQLSLTELRGLQSQIDFIGTGASIVNDLEYILYREGSDNAWLEETVTPQTTLSPGDVVEVRIVSSNPVGVMLDEDPDTDSSLEAN